MSGSTTYDVFTPREATGAPSQAGITEDAPLGARVDVGTLVQNLWPQDENDIQAYAILDGQWVPELYARLMEAGLPFCSLLDGPATQVRVTQAPYLVRLHRGDAFALDLLARGWGQGWGIYFQASASAVRAARPDVSSERVERKLANGTLQASSDLVGDEPMMALRHHFRRFTRVAYPDGRVVAFRFYDPAVLGVWLQAANVRETDAFFGPVRLFLYEDFHELPSLNRPQLMRISYRSGSSAVTKFYDAASERSGILKKPPNAAGEVEALRAPSGHLRLRAETKKAFAARELETFKETISIDVIAARYDSGLATDNRVVRRFVSDAVDEARREGLRTRKELSLYVLCSMRHGASFSDRHGKSLREAREEGRAEGFLAELTRRPPEHQGA